MSGVDGSTRAGTEGTDHEKHAVVAQARPKIGLQTRSPYTVKNFDDAIAHLEVAIAADSAMAIFGRRYWRDRVRQIGSTPGILHTQMRRLQGLLERLSCTA